MSNILAQARDRDIGAEDAPYYFNSAHWRAIDGALEGISERLGLIVISGPTGSGKSTVMRTITQQAGASIRFLTLPYANLGVVEFINFIEKGFEAAKGVPDARSNAEAVKRFTLMRGEAGESLVILIDEAQNLSDEVTENLPRLLRFGTDKKGRPVGLQFILVGGDELTRKLSERRFDAARSALGAHFQLRNFTRSEMEAFLKRRLAPIARMTREPITPEGVDSLALYTAGNPRLLGMVCAHAMLFAAETPGRSIDKGMVEEAAKALMLEPKPEGPPADDEIHEAPLLQAAPKIELKFDPAAHLDPDEDEDDDEDPDVWNEGDRSLKRRSKRSAAEQISAKIKGMVGKTEMLTGRRKSEPASGRRAARRPRTRAKGRGRETLRWALRLGGVGLVVLALWAASGPAGQGYDSIRSSIVAWLNPPPGPTGIGFDPATNFPTDVTQTQEQTGVFKAATGALINAVDSVQVWLFGAVDAPMISMLNLPLGEMRKVLEMSLTTDPLTASDAYAADGERYFAESKYIEPRGENAYDSYRRALALNERNDVALKGVENLIQTYERLAQEARDRRDWNAANLLYQRAVSMRDLSPIGLR